MVFTDLFRISGIFALPVWLIVLASAWTVVWKGLALWKAAAVKKSLPWFIALLIINTLGILEILYFFIFSEIKPRDSRSRKARKTVQIKKSKSTKKKRG